jgi:VWFA-related protein
LWVSFAGDNRFEWRVFRNSVVRWFALRFKSAPRHHFVTCLQCGFLIATPSILAGADIALAHPQPIPASQQALQTAADLVKVDVSVADKRGNFLADLSQNDFRVLDNGLEQATVFFMPVETPAQIVVMIEAGPAVYLIHSEHLSAAYALVNGLDPGDRVALVAYDEAPRQILAFTSDKSALLPALAEIQYNMGMGDLNFYGSLSQVLDWLKPVSGKRALVLLTTGLDSSQPSLWGALAEKLRREDLVIFPVALGGALRGAKSPSKGKPSGSSSVASIRLSPPDTIVSFAKADQALRSLAAITGGSAYFPGSREDFLSIYGKIAAALRHQYVLGFVPSHDGKYHSISVELAASNGQPVRPKKRKAEYHVFARAGYLAPGP